MGFIFTLFYLVFLAVGVAALVGMWKAFEKAGQPGWAGIVPIYNIYVLTLMAKKPVLWVVLCIIPCVQIYFLILLLMEIAKLFGKEPIFGLLMFVGVGWLILGFTDAKYTGEVVKVTMPQVPGSTPPPPAAPPAEKK
jgi:hypothetical protein